jgi:hypothetical protein
MPEFVSYADAKRRGIPRYFEGSQCRHGHIAERYTSTKGCVICAAESTRKSVERKRYTAKPSEHDILGRQENDMKQWQNVGPGRYAIQYRGHLLQVARNPDVEDQRGYISIVDRVPLEQASWSYSEAKTKAIKFVERQTGNDQKLAEALELMKSVSQSDPAPNPEDPGPAPHSGAQYEDEDFLGLTLNTDILEEPMAEEPMAVTAKKEPATVSPEAEAGADSIKIGGF